VDIVDEEDGQVEGSTNIFPLRMASDTTRGRIIAASGGFLRGTAGQQVNFDPEAPPLPPALQQTTCLLERPEIDKKVKVTNAKLICVVSKAYTKKKIFSISQGITCNVVTFTVTFL